MTHVGLQTDKSIDELEAHLKLIGIKGFIEFDKKEPGLYLMSVNPLTGSSSLEDFSTQEIEEELEDRKGFSCT